MPAPTSRSATCTRPPLHSPACQCCSAACDDVVAWSILALVIAISRASSPLSAVWTMLSTAAFVLGMFLVVNPILKRVAIAMGRKDKEASGSHYNSASLPTWFFVLVVLLCLASAYVTEVSAWLRVLRSVCASTPCTPAHLACQHTLHASTPCMPKRLPRYIYPA